MKWQDSYSVGITEIDNQHKRIFTLCGEYVQDCSAGKGEEAFPTFLKVLRHYCATHFEFEESCMRYYQCPFAERNKEQHANFFNAVNNFYTNYEVNGFNVSDAQLLAQTVQEWLADHICKIDMSLKKSVQDHSEG